MSNFHKQTAEFLASVVQNIPREISRDVMQGWIENPSGLQRVLQAALCPPPKVPEFKVWKTIKLGVPGLKTADDFRAALEAAGHKIGNWGSDIMGKKEFTVDDRETEVDLVVVSNADLGRPEGCTRAKTYELATKAGLLKCPAEVGPQLRLQYPDQPKGEWLLIGMDPIPDSNGNLRVFYVGRDGDDLWLISYDGGPDDHWDGDTLWVFVCPRKLVLEA